MDPCWLHVEYDSDRLGASVLLTHEFAVTAWHCISELVDGSTLEIIDGADLELVSASGIRFTARVEEKRGDLGLLRVSVPRTPGSPAPGFPVPVEALDRWIAECRPTLSHAALTGKVAATSLPYKCEDGTEIEALQLDVDQGVGSHKGFSGGPILATGQNGHSNGVMGLLLEEYPDQAILTRAANVLFGATIATAFESFSALDLVQVLGLTSRQLIESNTVSGPTNHEKGDLNGSNNTMEDRLADGEKILLSAREWLRNGLIDPEDYSIYQMRVRDTLIFQKPEGGV